MDGEGRRKAGTSLGDAKSKDDEEEEEKAGETEEEEGRDCLRERFLGRREPGKLRSKTSSESSAGGIERRLCVGSSSLSEGHDPSEDEDDDEGTGEEIFRLFARGS